MPRRVPGLSLTGIAWLSALAMSGFAGACGGPGPEAASSTDAGAADAATTDASVTSPLCVDGKATSSWPPGPYGIALSMVPPPDLAWTGPGGTIALADYYEPCATRSRLLVIRSTAAWCGTCGWHATHTTRLLGGARFSGRLRLVDLLVADEDNMPASFDALARWQARVDVPASVDARFGSDAKYLFAPVLPSNDALPEYVLVDTRTMQVLNVQSNPAPEQLVSFLDLELARLDGLPRPDLVAPTLHDGLLSDDQFDMLQDMKVPAAPPPDPTNEVADNPEAAAFGRTLFADASLSATGTVACITCHDPTKGFADGRAIAEGATRGDRNSPSIALAAHARWQFWDGRADTLWMQALGPLENEKEFASSRLFVAHAVVDRYAATYGSVFGARYPLPDLGALPANGKPGDAAYDALPQATRDAITRVFVNVGKSLAAYERTLRVAPNALDRYAGGDLGALATPERESLRQFFELGCAQCHWGPRLTDDAFHVIGFPTGRADGAADRGRADVLLGLAGAEFIASSRWSDAPATARPLASASVPETMVGAFKTPPLRGVARTAPFGHGGTYTQLADVAQQYGTRASQVPAAKFAGTIEPWLPQFDTGVQAQLPALLQVLTADVMAP